MNLKTETVACQMGSLTVRGPEDEHLGIQREFAIDVNVDANLPAVRSNSGNEPTVKLPRFMVVLMAALTAASVDSHRTAQN